MICCFYFPFSCLCPYFQNAHLTIYHRLLFISKNGIRKNLSCQVLTLWSDCQSIRPIDSDVSVTRERWMNYFLSYSARVSAENFRLVNAQNHFMLFSFPFWMKENRLLTQFTQYIYRPAHIRNWKRGCMLKLYLPFLQPKSSILIQLVSPLHARGRIRIYWALILGNQWVTTVSRSLLPVKFCKKY